MNQQELIDLIHKICITKEELEYALAHMKEWQDAYEKSKIDHFKSSSTDTLLFPQNKE